MNGTQLEVWDCNGGANQKITYSSSAKTLKVLGKCLDIAGGVNANSTPLQLATCNGGGYQNWVVNSNGSISNPTTGRCIDSPAGATAVVAGTRFLKSTSS